MFPAAFTARLEHMTVAPSEYVTVPFGFVPVIAGLNAELNVTDWFVKDGFVPDVSAIPRLLVPIT